LKLLGPRPAPHRRAARIGFDKPVYTLRARGAIPLLASPAEVVFMNSPLWLRAWVMMLGSVLLHTEVGAQHPFRGSLRWSVLLCRYSDSPATARGPVYFTGMFVNRAAGGLASYWAALSRNGVTTNEVAVRGWFTISQTVAQATAGGDRNRMFNDCVAAAASGGYTPPAGFSVAVVTNPGVDLWGGGGRAFASVDSDVGAFSHEVGHGLGLNHSFSDDPNYRNASWSQIGEYDDQWDVMSYANVFGMPTASFGFGGPGLNGYHLDRMGWLPRDEVLTMGADGASTRTVSLRPLHGSAPGGVRLVRVPFDPNDLFRYYTVELRTRGGWDAGIPAAVVLIHEVRRVGTGYFSYLLRERTAGRAPVQSLNANGVSIRVDRVDAATGEARVTISTEIVSRCISGYVWRDARPGDRVCVTGAVREEARRDNAAAASRRNPGGGAFGPDTCRQGFVWREAFPGDHVCVTGSVRARTRAENASAASRGNPARLAFGPNTCRAGFVWREADLMDYMCVTVATRAETRQENLLAAARRNPGGGAFGPDTCRQGFVWRDAYPGDHVCVTGASRTRARADNAAGPGRVAQQ
jgi:hypothetical protein